MINLKTTVDKLKFINPICNASGVLCRTVDELVSTYLSNTGSVITKSSTLNERDGNKGTSYWENDKISINSKGLPNYGYKYYCDILSQLPMDYKHCFLSIANISNTETKVILNNISKMEYISYPEINVSCPNIVGKEQMAYNLEELDNFLKNVVTPNYNKPYGLKLPPFFDPVHIKQMSDVIREYQNIKYLTCINSVGNTLDVDLETKCGVIDPKGGLGGLGGESILPIALSNVYQFKKNLPELDIIGCGGIKTGEDVFKHILVGASMVQIGTTLNREKYSCINRILGELKDIMKKNNYNSIDDFKGKYNI